MLVTRVVLLLLLTTTVKTHAIAVLILKNTLHVWGSLRSEVALKRIHQMFKSDKHAH